MEKGTPANAGSQLDPGFEGHFEGLHHGQLRLPYCEECTRFHWYPLKHCPFCQGSWRWREVRGPFELFSWTHVHRHFSDRDDLTLPYTVLLVVADDAPGVRIISRPTYDGTAELREAMALELVIDRKNAVLTFRARRAYEEPDLPRLASGGCPASREL